MNSAGSRGERNPPPSSTPGEERVARKEATPGPPTAAALPFSARKGFTSLGLSAEGTEAVGWPVLASVQPWEYEDPAPQLALWRQGTRCDPTSGRGG